MKLIRYFETLKHCKPIQIYSRLLNKFPKKVQHFCIEDIKNNTDIVLLPTIPKRETWLASKRFRFLNRDMDFGDSIGWTEMSLPKLWTYNLHYFDYLNQVKFHPQLTLQEFHRHYRDCSNTPPTAIDGRLS